MTQSSQPQPSFHHARIIGRTDRILTHLETAVGQFNGNGGSIEEAINIVCAAHQLTQDLRDFLTPDPDTP